MQTFFSREQDYALRITAFLAGAALSEKDCISVSEISKKLYLSKAFSARIVHKLKQGRILSSKQGLYGGVYLGRDPKNLSFYEVLTAVGFDNRLNECLKGTEICNLKRNCNIHMYFRKREEELVRSLKETMISDFTYNIKMS